MCVHGLMDGERERMGCEGCEGWGGAAAAVVAIETQRWFLCLLVPLTDSHSVSCTSHAWQIVLQADEAKWKARCFECTQIDEIGCVRLGWCLSHATTLTR